MIATEIAVLAASSAPADTLAAQAVERALGARAVARHAVAAVRTEAFAPLGQARRLVAQARKQDLNVEFDAAEASLEKAIRMFETHPAAREELADAWIWRGIVAFHAKHDPGAAFARAKSIDPARQLTRFEVHPEIATLYAAASDGSSQTELPPVETAAPEELCDLLWCDATIVVAVSEQNGRSRLVGTRYDARARAFTERVVAGNAATLVDELLGAPAFAHAQPSLILPPDPAPPKIWQRTWFWTAVGGAAAALAGSLIYADATRDTHANVVVPPGVFGGH